MADADQEVRELCRTLLGDDDSAAIAAAKSLGAMHLRAKDAVPAVALTLRHASRARREAAAKAICQLAAWSADYLPTIQAAAKDADPAVRAAAEEALAAIEGNPPREVGLLASAS